MAKWNPNIGIPRPYYNRIRAESVKLNVPMWRYICEGLGYEPLVPIPEPVELCLENDEVHSFCLVYKIPLFQERVLRVLYEANGRRVQDWSIIDFIWPRAEGDRGLRNLHVVVCKLRKKIPIERDRAVSTWLPPESIAMIKACKDAG